MLNKVKDIISTHPWDYLIHFVLCGLGVLIGGAHVGAVIIVSFSAIIIEYEQKFSVWNYELSWFEYLKKKAIGDLIADILGILAGLIISRIDLFVIH